MHNQFNLANADFVLRGADREIEPTTHANTHTHTHIHADILLKREGIFIKEKTNFI